ncbi:hypothetical protein [Metabacillus idriensis]|uniref:hypothetical protein n=1 Tax=Metabacillus idriensis TaxID=324768 RepID=UPI001CD80640|nr:hypothetical protein [Metabacillus idriensis]
MKQNEMIIGSNNFRKNDNKIILQNYSGNYLTPSIIRGSIRSYCKKAGVGYKGTHGFRHTHAVQFSANGA